MQYRSIRNKEQAHAYTRARICMHNQTSLRFVLASCLLNNIHC